MAITSSLFIYYHIVDFSRLTKTRFKLKSRNYLLRDIYFDSNFGSDISQDEWKIVEARLKKVEEILMAKIKKKVALKDKEINEGETSTKMPERRKIRTGKDSFSRNSKLTESYAGHSQVSSTPSNTEDSLSNAKIEASSKVLKLKTHKSKIESKTEDDNRNFENALSLKFNNHVRRKVILILAQGRSGTSLLGDLFDRDTNAFYMFEPLLVIERLNGIIHFELEDESAEQFYNNESKALLTSLMTCHPNPTFQKYMKNYDDYGSRTRTSAFWRQPFCKKYAKQCRRMEGSLVEIVCRNLTNYTVMKELEFRIPGWNMKMLIELANSLGVDLKIIHLVRDPRSYLSSQMKLGWFFDDTNITARKTDLYTKSRCDETLRYIKEIEINKDEYKYKMKYFLIRYEDLIDSPKLYLKKLDDFIQIDVYNRSISWFQEVTNTKGSGYTNRYQNGPRNATLVKNAWKKHISKNLMHAIRTHCSKLMERLGYILGESDEEVQKDAFKTVTNFDKLEI